MEIFKPDPKKLTPRSKEYLDWLAEQRCVLCGHKKEEYRDVVATHQTFDGRGVALKPNDYHALPQCTFCHAEEHHKGNKTMWKGINKEKLIIAHLVKFIKERKKHD